MAKKPINERCPLQSECGRKKCEFQFHEAKCNYYIGNSRPGYEIPDQETADTPIWDDAAETTDVAVGLTYIPIDELYPHPDNPRKDLGDLTELADSIKAKGVLQNLTVVRGHAQTQEEWSKYNKLYNENPSEELREKINAKWYEDGYTVIIGHRRTEASRMAGLTALPCIIADMTPEEQVTTMMLENMQRSDLTIYEQAKGFQLMLDFGNTIETVAEKSGFSPTTIRRRVKLLELDEEKFKKTVSRGVTLFEYAELDKIKDIDLRNEVLDTIGTDNFKYSLKRAIDKEKNKEYLDFVESEVTKFATKIESSEGYNYKKGYGTYSYVDTVPIPEDAETVEYYYTRSESYVSIYTKVDETAEAEEKQRAAEKEEKRKQKIGELEEMAESAYELRKEFVDSLTTTEIKKHLAEIVAFWMYREVYSNTYSRLDSEEILNILGIEIDEDNGDDLPFDYEDTLNAVKQSPEIKLWKMICLTVDDDENEHYFQRYYGTHDENRKLSDWYDLLVRLGYEMSDEEKALRDGTHELFITEESE